MNEYIPFLKTKTNEFSALNKLSTEVKTNIVPFFDLHRKEDNYTEKTYKKLLLQIKQKITKLTEENISYFYLDDFDIPNDLLLENKISYETVINLMVEFNFIPVIGIDRLPERNEVVFKNNNLIKTKTVAIRINLEEMKTKLEISDLQELITKAKEYYATIIIILDARLITEKNYNILLENAKKILKEKNILDYKLIFTGSTIPANIKDIIASDSNLDLPRKEISLYTEITRIFPNTILGDYTIISPYYSDVKINKQLIQNIMTPKIIYAYNNYFFIQRGKSIKQFGNKQYTYLCQNLISRRNYRGKNYSFGDTILYECAKDKKKIIPGSAIQYEVNAHITYMVQNFQI